MNMMFGFSNRLLRDIPADISTREFILFIGIPVQMYWLGISWQAFVV
jgi:hypothetical protein